MTAINVGARAPEINLSRRGMARAGAIFALGGMAAVPSPSPDAELIALCADLDKLSAEFQALDRNAVPYTPADEALEAEEDRIYALQGPLVDRICAQQASTLPGFLALAHSLARWDPECAQEDDAHGCTDDRLRAALLRSMTAGRA